MTGSQIAGKDNGMQLQSAGGNGVVTRNRALTHRGSSEEPVRLAWPCLIRQGNEFSAFPLGSLWHHSSSSPSGQLPIRRRSAPRSPRARRHQRLLAERVYNPRSFAVAVSNELEETHSTPLRRNRRRRLLARHGWVRKSKERSRRTSLNKHRSIKSRFGDEFALFILFHCETPPAATPLFRCGKVGSALPSRRWSKILSLECSRSLLLSRSSFTSREQNPTRSLHRR